MVNFKWLTGNNPKKRRTRVIRHDPMFEYELFLKPGALDSIRKAKGYKNWTELADALKITKQYLSNLKTGTVGVSHTFIIRIAVLLNNLDDKWWTFYEIRPTKRKLSLNSPIFNQEKYDGKLPYAKYSPSGNARKVDGVVEFAA
jgi:transcriptional regulator with XRE-family HTH domain